jgi:hypothetical protein
MKEPRERESYVGHCPVCEGAFKVRDGKMVHHGFKRPGDGSIHGDCFGVGLPPYECSPEGCHKYRAIIEGILGRQLERAEKLSKNQIPYFTNVNVGRHRITTIQYAVGVTERYAFIRRAEEEKRKTEREIRDCNGEISRMDNLITSWVNKDLTLERTLIEQDRVAKEDRARERAQKRAEKEAKEKALIEKKTAKKEARRVFLTKFIGDLRAATTKEQIEVLVVLFKSKKTERLYGHLYWTDLQPIDPKWDELLIEKGIGVRTSTGFLNCP